MTPPIRLDNYFVKINAEIFPFCIHRHLSHKLVRRRGGAPRSESIIPMIAGGNHTIIYMTPPYSVKSRNVS